MWIATAEHCKEVDIKTIAEYGIPAMILMEQAGRSVLQAVEELLPDKGQISILCGKGNNGGDGLVVARLALSKGYSVTCLIAAHEQELSLDASTQLAVSKAQGIDPIFLNDTRWARELECLCYSDLIVDGLLGTGVHGAVKGAIKDAIQAINCSGAPVISIDIPSGINVDTGEEANESVWATRTVTFGLPKPFLFQGIGIEHSGEWTVADIGWPAKLTNEPTEAFLLSESCIRTLLPERLRSSHKGDNGHILIVAGSDRMPGAAVLAAYAALRAGVGLVTVASVESVCHTVAAHLPEAIHLPLPQIDGVISPKAAEILIDSQHSYSSAIFGPGLSQHHAVQEMLEKTWTIWEKPSCIDADALNAISAGIPLPPAKSVLTPHPGEMGRLLRCSTAEVQADRMDTVKTACEQFNKTVLLKGAYSIVGQKDKVLAINPTGNSGMATGGMGDILSGVIGTLLARDLPPYDAAICGMYLHGYAGDICAEEIGDYGYFAREVADRLPEARQRILDANNGFSI